VVTQENWSFAAPGDSGSAVDKDGEFVGLLYAGSADCAVICKAEHIIEGFGIAVEPPEGQYSLTISSTPGGTITEPGVGRFTYDDEKVIPLVAKADEYYKFDKWTGNVSTIGNVTAAETTITVNGNYKITANFKLKDGYCSLTVSSTEGGSVTPTEGIHVYEASAEVELFAVPDEHYEFVEWTGDVSTIDNVYSAATNITMNDSYSITANFELKEGWYSLTISSTEGGSVTEPGEGIFTRAANTTVGLVAEADEDYEFDRWTGDVSTVGNVTATETTIAMNASYSITASFKSWYPEPMAMLIISSTRGGSVITPREGTHLYPLGVDVSLVAEPDEGGQFLMWTGDVDNIADVYAASTTITVDSPYTIRADFSGTGLCFIATVVYGTSIAGEIEILRGFRDEYLLTNPVGRVLVDLYYRVSPPMAKFITEHPSLKPIVRAGLLPAVTMSTVAVNTTPVEKIAIIGLLALVSVALAVWAARRRGRGPQYT
jgi:hypothetical protein